VSIRDKTDVGGLWGHCHKGGAGAESGGLSKRAFRY